MFVTGYNISCVYKYNPVENIFTSHVNFPGSMYKLICTANNKLYILNSQGIHESKDKELTTFENIGECQIGNNCGLSYKVRNGNFIYFLLSSWQILKFDTYLKRSSILRKTSFS
jgi:hypothetical protein